MTKTPIKIEPGQMIGGVYRITEMIGKGGFSEVWSAWDTRLNRVVAVKIIPIAEVPVEEDAIRFRRESLIVTRMEHHHILPLYDFGEEQTFRYLVMRYVSGGSLADRLNGRVPIAPEDIIRWIAPIAITLDYIHEQRVVHRDIKPGNILFDAQNIPYLADFGLAKELSDYTQQIHSASGTLVYMPPEQFYGEALSTKSDQFSFGILLFQLFTGVLPFKGEYAHGVRQLANDDPLPNINDICPSLPPELNNVLRNLTATRPADRPVSAVQVIHAIASLFDNMSAALANPVSTGSLALESGAFRRHEADLLLEKYLPGWQAGSYSLSRTHFMLLDMIFAPIALSMSAEGRSLMLRGALETGLQLGLWWGHATDGERKRAAWNALNSANREVCWRAVTSITPMGWATEADYVSLNKLGDLLLPVSDFTEVLLTFLEHALPPAKDWLVDPTLTSLDTNLRLLALNRSHFAKRAAYLIGKARRTEAAKALPTNLASIGPLLNVYEVARSLPKGPAVPPTLLLTIMLTARQLAARPLKALQTYLWAAAGNGLGLALMVFVVYRSLTLVSTVRLLNSIGQGLIFGAIYGLGVALARHVRTELGGTRGPLRWLLAIIFGGLVLTLGFSLYQKLIYDDTIEFVTCLVSGVLYISGFVITADMSRWFRLAGGAAGIAAAYLLPWWLYLQPDSTIQPPFFFNEANPLLAIILVVVSALLISAITLGDLWLPARKHSVIQEVTPQANWESSSSASPETIRF